MEGDRVRIFADLCGRVRGCRACARMCESARILGPSSGSLDAKIMFVGEAPGRLGADGSGIPFHGDRAGDNFEDLIEFAGISRAEIFVTNAVLCNPKDERGNNASPRRTEVENCSLYLNEQIQLVAPEIVVTLGATALSAAGLIEQHNLKLKESVRTSIPWNNRRLVPLYHPGQRAMMHRSMANQRSDYEFVASLLRSKQKTRQVRGVTPSSTAELVRIIIGEMGEISYFGLHKILYLTECAYATMEGIRLSKANFIRQKDGPYCTDIQIRRLTRSIPDLQVRKRGEDLTLALDHADLFAVPDQESCARGTVQLEIIMHSINKYRTHTKEELKNAAYMSRPMRKILRTERVSRVNMYNTPIDFTCLFP